MLELKKSNKEIKYPKFSDLIKKGDLIYYQGPWLSHFISKDNKHYFLSWVENDEISNRWMLFEVDKKDLMRFLKSEISELEIILKNSEVSIVEIVIDKEFKIKIREEFQVSIEDIHESYLPSKDSFYEDSFYEDSFYEDYCQELKKELGI